MNVVNRHDLIFVIRLTLTVLFLMSSSCTGGTRLQCNDVTNVVRVVRAPDLKSVGRGFKSRSDR